MLAETKILENFTLFRLPFYGTSHTGNLFELNLTPLHQGFLIGFYDGRDHTKELVGGKRKENGKEVRVPERIEVRDPFLTILAGTQKDNFLEMADAGDVFAGFLPRFAFDVPETRPDRKDVDILDVNVSSAGDRVARELKKISESRPTQRSSSA